MTFKVKQLDNNYSLQPKAPSLFKFGALHFIKPMDITFQHNPVVRKYLPKDFLLVDASQLNPYFTDLENRELLDFGVYQQFLMDVSELDAFLEEDMAWRYIRMTCDTANEDHRKAYQFFVEEVFPLSAPVFNRINQKIVGSSFAEQLGEEYHQYLKKMAVSIEIYREENIPIQTELQNLAAKYGQISGAMSVEHDGKELTLQQASQFLKDKNRDLRAEVYAKIANRRAENRAELNQLLDKMIQLRHQLALNAGFENYVDYRFKELSRFDYTPEDCEKFHDAIEVAVVPLVNKMLQERKKTMALDVLRPWDLKVEPDGKPKLEPFKDGIELIEKSIETFSKLHPYLGSCLKKMDELKHFDLEARLGKAPGGYNYPLAETGAPFIFMNSAGSLDDLITMMHEGGHAVHSFLTHQLPLSAFKQAPTEVAEVASMAMELLSMENWNIFFPNDENLARAKKKQLERSIGTLPWIAQVDAFQLWLYRNPNHTEEERTSKWLELDARFGGSEVNFEGFEQTLAHQWQAQLHIYEVPFYYIEYGFAQLGAISVYKNYKENSSKGLQMYFEGLALGGTKSIPEIYHNMGINFGAEEAYLKELMYFIDAQMVNLN